ncbi:MAG: hypothetical protein ACK4IS_01150 [Erythrobacter sp.]
MRTALLAAFRKTPQGLLRASLILAERSVLSWQATLACALGCERVIILSNAPDEAFAEAARTCRSHGAAFLHLRQFAGLAALIHADDELLMIGDGLLPDRESLQDLVAPAGVEKPLAKVVLCLPADHPQAARWPEDFERIDAARCWAGVAVMRAAPVQRLVDFPPDSNPVSLLLRMALQEGTPCRTLSGTQSAENRWLLAHGPEVLGTQEQALIADSRKAREWSAPALALVEEIAARWALRGAGMAAPGTSLGGLACLIAALGAGAAGWDLLALVCALLGSLALDLGAALGRIRRAVLGSKARPGLAYLHHPGRDVLAGIAIMAALGPGALAALAPLAIGTAVLASRAAPPRFAAFWQDRTAQLAIMTLGAGLGWLGETTALLALGALAQTLFADRFKPIPE